MEAATVQSASNEQAGKIQASEILHLPNGEGRALQVLSQRITFKRSAENSPYALLESLDAPQSGPPPHIHHTQDEAFYILEGQYEFYCGDQIIMAGPGSFVHIPKGTVHTLRNVGEVPARALVILTPPGPLERFFEEVGDVVTDEDSRPSPAGPPDIDMLMASARRNEMEIILPDGA